jgi:hypothetical protein
MLFHLRPHPSSAADQPLSSNVAATPFREARGRTANGNIKPIAPLPKCQNGSRTGLKILDASGLLSSPGRLAIGDRFGHRCRVIAHYNNKSLVYGAPGLVLQIGCQMRMRAEPPRGGGDLVLCMFGSLVGTVLLFAGCSYYAKAKGRSFAWGLVALLSCFGLVILACLKDKTNHQVGPPSPPAPPA